jgi:hypothetical protein
MFDPTQHPPRVRAGTATCTIAPFTGIELRLFRIAPVMLMCCHSALCPPAQAPATPLPAATALATIPAIPGLGRLVISGTRVVAPDLH